MDREGFIEESRAQGPEGLYQGAEMDYEWDPDKADSNLPSTISTLEMLPKL
jgi:hypothetical protein